MMLDCIWSDLHPLPERTRTNTQLAAQVDILAPNAVVNHIGLDQAPHSRIPAPGAPRGQSALSSPRLHLAIGSALLPIC